MKVPGVNPFHTLLLLTEKPAGWANWQIALLPLAQAAASGLIWANVAGNPVWGWTVTLGLLALALADWGWLVSLPRRGISFGAPQPPFLALTVLRGLITLVAVFFANHWLHPAFAGLALVQVLLWVLMVYSTQIEPYRLQVTRLTIPTHKFSNPGMPVHILQLSDLHVERLTRRELALPSLVAELAPDVIILTGDFLSTSYNQDRQALADLRALLAQLNAPDRTYAVWGTIEVDLPNLLRPVLEDLDIIVLEDQAVEVTLGDQRLWMIGVSCTRDPVADGARLGALLADIPPDAFTLLLHHMPDLMPQAASLGVDLFLAGHTHGGQWRIPGFGAIVTSSRYWKRYEAGHYTQGDTHLYVSRGIGMEGFGTPRARLFCPPEAVSITLVGTGEGR